MTEVSRLTEADHGSWTELWRAYLRFYETELPESVYQDTWARILHGTAIHGLAARLDGEIVGITHFLFHNSAWTTTPVCYLQDLFVVAAARGHGAGRALIEAVAEEARSRGAARLYWMTQAHNATARQLYDRLAKHNGFIRYDYPPL